ncbi:MAG: hypothetical protein INR69_15600 [Mucilaginibacter polytrichastri]|nr:hypothetical protein [Mucilaginibacter polytrichastri]
MKKLSLLAALFAVFFLFGQDASAQSYENAVGLRVEFGTGSAGVGPNFKHFFSEHDAIDASLLFYEGAIAIGGEYQYHLPVTGADGLAGYFGLGPQIGFATGKYSSDDVAIAISPVAGLDYKIPGAPIAVAFDWRPRFLVTPDTEFTAARFGLTARFTF